MWNNAHEKEWGERTEENFEMNGEKIEVIEEYKYLGYTINQHLECKGVVKERANAGAMQSYEFLVEGVHSCDWRSQR